MPGIPSIFVPPSWAPAGRSWRKIAAPTGVRLPYAPSRLKGTKLSDPRTPTPAANPATVPTVRWYPSASAPTSYSVVGGTDEISSSAALFRTYSARPNKAFVPSRSSVLSSTTLLASGPGPIGSFAP
jgi:hypothetical protein